jgi:cytochrome c oxidase cbb3-type subunit 1
MSPAPSLAAAIDPRTNMSQERAELTRSTHPRAGPIFGTSAVWLLVGTIFALISSWKMHNPELLAQYEWLTFGRVRTAHLNTVIYGWATNAGIGVSFWLMARLSRTLLRHAGILYVSGAAWNLGVIIGRPGILGRRPAGGVARVSALRHAAAVRQLRAHRRMGHHHLPLPPR